MSQEPPAIRRRRWLTFSLRTFFVLLTIIAVGLGWHIRAVRRQQASAAAIRDIGGWYYYDFQIVPAPGQPDYAAVSPMPQWLVELLGVDFFHNVVQVNLNYSYDADGRHENSRGTGDDLRHLLGFPKLRMLLMSKHQASDEGLAYVGGLSHLERLYIWDAYEVTDAGVQHLQSLTKLEYLHLSNSKVSDEAFKVLGEMPSLTGLSLQRNAFTNKGLAYLRQNTKLEELHIGLGKLDVDDEGLAHLQNLSNLRELDIQGSDVRAPALQHFRQTHPNCKIDR